MGRTRSLLRVLRAAQEPSTSQSEIARRVGMTRMRYWAIENGELEPTTDERKAIASALGVTVADIAWPEVMTPRVSA